MSQATSGGLEPLWVLGLLSRLSIIIGMAILYWFSIIALGRLSQPWLETLAHLEQIQLAQLPTNTNHLFIQAKSLLLMGIFLLIPLNWWRGSFLPRQAYALAIFILLLTARGWLRYNQPRHQKMEWGLTIFTFVSGLFILTVVAL